MKIKRKQKFALKTANESQAQKYYYKRIKIGAMLLCILYLITCGTAVVLGLKSSKQDMAKVNVNTMGYTDIFLMRPKNSPLASSDVSFPKYELPDFIADYTNTQTLSMITPNSRKNMRYVSPCAALFDSNMDFVSSNLRATLIFDVEAERVGGAYSITMSPYKQSAPIPFQTYEELKNFTDAINAAIDGGGSVTAEGYTFHCFLYPDSVTIKGNDGSQKTIKITTDYDLPSGMPRATYNCLWVFKESPQNKEAPLLSSKYLNKNTIINYKRIQKELLAKSNVFKAFYIYGEKISLVPLGYSGKYNISEYYSYNPKYIADNYKYFYNKIPSTVPDNYFYFDSNQFDYYFQNKNLYELTYFDRKSSQELPSEEYYIVSYGTYSPLRLAISQVEIYSTVNFMNMTLILFAGIFLLTVVMLTLLKKRLRQIEQNRKDLIMSIAHEMKTPFGIVRLYGEKILITPDPEAKEDFAADMMEEIDEMNSLLQNILDASRLDSGSLKLNKTSFIMNDAVEDILEGYAPLAADKNIKLTLNATEQYPVEADNYRIKQVISNLLSNAVKNTPENGKIDITIKKDGKNTAVTVKNTGKPIPKEKIHRIWDAFYKHDENADNSKSGAGLGLSIVKNIISLHGGYCGVENKADGVEFWFRI